MRICIFGAGAIGGLIAARLAVAGEDVTVIGRGAHLTAIKAKGIELHWQDGRIEPRGSRPSIRRRAPASRTSSCWR